MPMYKNICKVCGKEIITYMSNKLVCSKECRTIADRKYAKEFMRKKRAGEKRTCLECKKEVVFYHKAETICSECKAKRVSKTLLY